MKRFADIGTFDSLSVQMCLEERSWMERRTLVCYIPTQNLEAIGALKRIYSCFPSVDPLGRFAGVPNLSKPVSVKRRLRTAMLAHAHISSLSYLCDLWQFPGDMRLAISKDSLCNFTPNFANNKISVNTSNQYLFLLIFLANTTNGSFHSTEGKSSEKLFTVFKLKCKSVAVFSLGQFWLDKAGKVWKYSENTSSCF